MDAFLYIYRVGLISGVATEIDEISFLTVKKAEGR